MLDQFRTFLIETNALALAVAVGIGAAVSKLVSALVAGIIMPLVSLALPGGAWREFTISLGEGNGVRRLRHRLALRESAGEITGSCACHHLEEVVCCVG